MSERDIPDAHTLADGIARWVRCESPSRDLESLARMADLIEADARAAGLSVHRHALDAATTGALHITSRRDGQTDPGLLILGHYDTVHPVGTLATNPCRIEEGRLYGPGVYDMKAGAYLALLAMARTRDTTALPVDFLLLPDEEIGSRYSRALTERIAAQARFALVCEPARAEGGRCVTSRKGTGTITLQTHGRPSHAGVAHAKGRSAVRELAHQILALEAMTDYDQGVTVNVGRIEGGTTGNVVPAHARADVDVRFPDAATAQALRERIAGLAAHDADVRLDVAFQLNRPPMPRTEAQAALFAQAQRLAATVGLDLQEAPTTGGGSDGNFTAALGVPTLDGIGADGDGAHTLREHVLIDTLPLRLLSWETWLRELQ